MAKKKEWREGEMILTFGLTKIGFPNTTPLLDEWLDVQDPILNQGEKYIFEHTYTKGTQKMTTWSEEDLKMKFISPVLELGGVMEDTIFASFFDKKLEAKVDGYNLSVKADFVIAKGLLDYMIRPFFHFQEYKPEKNPTGDPMAQLLEAFLIGQAQNDDDKPLYGCEVVGQSWRFIVMKNRTYCVSKTFNSMEREDLLKIISILRKFREILETKLL
ncbi:hypothetical protein VB796_10135 [Arcicella sp. LKC2W]|uniref:hypothetical protein n=1 Tax=Arcicella sp. LKC2W TaxID=2984198 RepID=UPI002B21C37E|nr:hypothetical protein [Arcicella sp. LKC2W]MEA5459399.1 hypothetical protein [Arcicella sp. LKC2W]